MIQIYFFYFFAVMTILSAIFVVFANNPVHSVLWLITSFFGVAGLFILLGAEFLALILMIVYVGALAVLFLFVVMMLNISFDGLRTGIVQYLPFGLFIGMLILAELLLALVPWEFKDEAFTNLATPLDKSDSNSIALGKVIYTEYFFIFQFFCELDDFEHVFSSFLEPIWDTLGHRILILGVLEPCLKIIDF